MRNQNSFFSEVPHANISRSKFKIPHSVKTSFNVGDLVPFYCAEVLPGDTFEIKTAKLIRMQTMITPPMDNMYADFYYFFVPNRLVWDHWKQFNGENTESAWLPTTEYSIPQLVAPSGGWSVGTLADYFGIPTGIGDISINALPIRAYSLICNEWFRDENLTDPLVIPTGDATVTGVNTGNYIEDTAKGGLPFKVSKYHDYFTSALPAPQKGPDVLIPMLGGDVPVVARNELVDSDLYPITSEPYTDHGTTTYRDVRASLRFTGSLASSTRDAVVRNTDGNSNIVQGAWSGTYGDNGLVPSNLWAITSGMTSAATINQLRLAFQIQKLYERDARGGTRYTEILKSHFGVTSPDARQQRPEYLGGNRLAINVNQVLQQSGTGAGSDTPQGTPTGTSLTTDNNYDFKKSFTEHGYVIGVLCVRYNHTYQQGIDRMWSRKTRFDFYWPALANIGEQAILNKEIYAQGSNVVDSDGNVVDEQVFAYQSAWSEYRYKPNIVTGEMRSQYVASLDAWHLADYYGSLPYLSDSWIREDKTNVDRVLAVQSSVSNQLFADIYVENKAVRPMPVFSVPGLIDHY